MLLNGCRRYSAASRPEVLLDEDDFRSSSQTLALGDVLLLFTTACDSPGTLKSIVVLLNLYGSPRSCWVLDVLVIKQGTFVDILCGLLPTYGSLRS